MTEIRPYAQGAAIYYRHGWQQVFPVGSDARPLAKSPVPEGVTGYDAAPIGWERIHRAMTSPRHGRRNLGIRMPMNVIGIDVDEYGDHEGAGTLAAAEAELGTLPATYRNSARGDGVSGHRYYRAGMGRVAIPGGEELLGKRFGPNIEILHYGRRYAVAWPSRNPDAGLAEYRWYGPDGAVLDGPPRVWDLPELAGGWRELLTAPIGSEAAKRSGGGNLRANKAAGARLEAGEGDDFDDAVMQIRRSTAVDNTLAQLEAVLTMRAGEVNKVLGGAGIWFARMTNAGLMDMDTATRTLHAAVAKNGVHSDAWNLANGRKWTAQSRIMDALSQGLNREPYELIEGSDVKRDINRLMQKMINKAGGTK